MPTSTASVSSQLPAISVLLLDVCVETAVLSFRTPALQMSVWAAAAVGAVKVPLYVSLWGRGDPSLSLLYRITRAVGISSLSVLATAACHANIRRAFRGRVRRLQQQQQQRQQKAEGGKAVATHSKKVD